MFLKRSIGGHHVLVRIAIGLAVVIALVIAGFFVAVLARRAFLPSRGLVAPAMHGAGYGDQSHGSAQPTQSAWT